jgi:hypothetical protein
MFLRVEALRALRPRRSLCGSSGSESPAVPPVGARRTRGDPSPASSRFKSLSRHLRARNRETEGDADVVRRARHGGDRRTLFNPAVRRRVSSAPAGAPVARLEASALRRPQHDYAATDGRASTLRHRCPAGARARRCADDSLRFFRYDPFSMLERSRALLLHRVRTGTSVADTNDRLLVMQAVFLCDVKPTGLHGH